MTYDEARKERAKREDIRDQKGLCGLAFVRQDDGVSNMLGHDLLLYKYDVAATRGAAVADRGFRGTVMEVPDRLQTRVWPTIVRATGTEDSISQEMSLQ